MKDWYRFMQRTRVSQRKLNEYRPHETYELSQVFCEICQLCKQISQKSTGQDSRNSLTGLTFSQAGFMQRIRVSQGKLNEYQPHETNELSQVFCEICQLCKQISQKRTGQDSRNSLTGLTLSQAGFMQRTRASQGKLNEYRPHKTYELSQSFVKYTNFASKFLKNAQDRIHVTLSLD